MKILIVEDEPGIVNFLRQGLEEEYFVVDVAYDGKTALEMTSSNQYNIILLDWMIPGISGIEFLKQLRKFDTQTPVIFITAKDSTEDVVFGLDAGANDYIKKPIKFAELLARIRVQLRKNNAEQNILTLGNISLHMDSHQVFVGEVEINLTKKEFALLELLMYNKGKICTRASIIEQVWDSRYYGDFSIIDVYINSLRKKLKIPKDSHLISTIRGVGYIAKE